MCVHGPGAMRHQPAHTASQEVQAMDRIEAALATAHIHVIGADEYEGDGGPIRLQALVEADAVFVAILNVAAQAASRTAEAAGLISTL